MLCLRVYINQSEKILPILVNTECVPAILPKLFLKVSINFEYFVLVMAVSIIFTLWLLKLVE